MPRTPVPIATSYPRVTPSLRLVQVQALLFLKSVNYGSQKPDALLMLRALASAMVVRKTASIALNPLQMYCLLQAVLSNLAPYLAAILMPLGVLFYILCLTLLSLPPDDQQRQSLLSAQIDTLYFQVPPPPQKKKKLLPH